MWRCLHLGEEHLLQPCGCLSLLISKWHFKNLSLNFHWWGVVSIFWSTSDTDIKNLSLGVYTLWSGCFHLLMRVPLLLISKSHWLQKPKFQHSPGGLSPTFDQQVILTCKWYWLQKPKFGCLHLLISVSLPFDQGVSTFRSASDTDFKNLSLGVSAFWSGCLWLLIRMSLPFDQQVTLTSKTYFPTFTRGVRGCLHLLISKWHLTSRGGCLCLLTSASDTDFKNLSLDVYTFWSVCLFPLIRVSPPSDQQVTLTSKT